MKDLEESGNCFDFNVTVMAIVRKMLRNLALEILETIKHEFRKKLN
ncbi:MAG: hypothetical protein LC117_02150 [Bacteroidia bacterium]|nr:hypothetical protein [Bacteroidia bacterium]MCZ2276717.1 hypothetical protein [Bacteroidia bacterium]